MAKILDEQYYDLIFNNTVLPQTAADDDITPMNERESILHVYRGDTTDMCMIGRYLYHNFPTIYTLCSLISLQQSGIQSVQLNPYLSLFGQGTLIGIIDTGIDYQHPAFLNRDGTTRIVSIWDQTIQNGPAPGNFGYGTEYNADSINYALRSANPLSTVPTVDENGHGTAVASIAAGNTDTVNNFSGVVPDAGLVVVKLKEAKQNIRELFLVPDNVTCYQETDLLLGIRYLIETAGFMNRPISICFALGNSLNGHDGEGSMSDYLDYLIQNPWIGISCCAGNEGNARRHYYSNITNAPYSEEFELRVGNEDHMFSMEIWPNAPAVLTIEVVSPTGETTQMIYPRIMECVPYSFTRSSSELWVNNILLEQESGNQCILIRIRNPVEGVWIFRVSNINSEDFSYHAWLPSGNLISGGTYFLQSSPDTTITSPGNAKHLITVTAYNQNSNSVLIESGRGYSRTGKVKPTLAAPGFELTCAAPLGSYSSYTGTGAAAAQTSGIVAMILEWAVIRGNYSQITGNDISNMLQRAAQRNEALTYPNNIWGYGMVNVNNLFDSLSL